MSDDVLERAQRLQFTQPEVAAEVLRGLLREVFPLDVRAVQLRPLAVSLNSINGTLSLADGRQLFFKTHVEPDNAIGEYYRANALAEAGWPVLQPLQRSTTPGRQVLLYEVVKERTVFDLAWEIEGGAAEQLEGLEKAQAAADEELLARYLESLAWQSAEEAGAAAVHQLFRHRLSGGRLARFYGAGTAFRLPQGRRRAEAVWQARWTINGQRYEETLGGLIQRALRMLEPAQAGPSVIGHGDAHNGNIFLREGGRMVYFDPAFAGRHAALLDLAKPLFHNVFAMWMYYPAEMAARTEIAVREDATGRWLVEHDYRLTPVREMFLRSKLERALLPTLRELGGRGWLRPDWRAYLKLALFCCPLLTMNLADAARYGPGSSALGLSQAMEMGAESAGERSRIDRALDEVAAQL